MHCRTIFRVGGGRPLRLVSGWGFKTCLIVLFYYTCMYTCYLFVVISYRFSMHLIITLSQIQDIIGVLSSYFSQSLKPPLCPILRFCLGPADISLMSKCAPCLGAPCQNNGTCVSDATGSYRCTCPYGFKVRHDIQQQRRILTKFFNILEWNEKCQSIFSLN